MLEARVKALESKVATRQQGNAAADAAAGESIAAGDAETGTVDCVLLLAASTEAVLVLLIMRAEALSSLGCLLCK